MALASMTPSSPFTHPSFLETNYVYELMHLGAWIYPVISATNDIL